MSFTATTSQTTIQYQTDDPLNSDPAIAVYRGSCGASLILVGCENSLDTTAVNGSGNAIPETFKFNTVEGLEYYIQIIDRKDKAGGMTGKYCIYNTTERDICNDNDLVTKVVGDCNVPFDVPVSFDNSGDDDTFPGWRDYSSAAQITSDGFTRVNRGCDPDIEATGVADVDSPYGVEVGAANSRDAWLRLVGNGQEVTITYQNKEAESNPALLVYTAMLGIGNINCDASGLNGVGNILNQLACSDTANATAGISQEGIQTEVVTFQSEAGRLYMIRVMDIDRGATDDIGMTGILCIADGSQRYNTCADAREIEVGECSVPINIIDEVNDCSTDTDANTLATNCLVGSEAIIFARESSGWRYEDNLVQTYPANDGEGDTWTEEDFDDSGWSTGSGIFGFSESGLSTTVQDLNNLTYYFRKTFTAAPGTYSTLRIRIRRDDGAVVYINGQQVVSTNMPATFNASTGASSTQYGSSERNYYEFDVPTSGLTLNSGAGANVIAVELHNRNASNGDLSFDLELAAVSSGTTTCTGSEGDAWATFTVPLLCDPDTDPATGTLNYSTSAPYTADCGAANLVANPGPDASFDPGNRSDDYCTCVANSVEQLPDDKVVVQYDNRNFTLDEAADVALVVFKANTCTDISTSTSPSPLVGCVDQLVSGEKGLEEILLENITEGETYYVRFINRETNKTALGTVCVLWGSTLAQSECPPENDYGSLDGEWKDFEVLGEWSTENSLPSAQIPGTDANITSPHPVPCVVPDRNVPASNNPNPIRSQAWMSFTVPAGFTTDENTTAVTIQYDNEGYSSGNPQNAAIAVYFMPNHPDALDGNCAAYDFATIYDDNNPDQPNLDGMQVLGCINSVFEGTESLTITVGEDTTYFARVMNVTAGSGTPANMPGRIRVFPFAPCTVSENLVRHGDFDNWPAIDDDPDGNNLGTYVTSTDYEDVNDWLITHPIATGTDRTSFIEDYARFATDYGYGRDRGRNRNGYTGNDSNLQNTRGYLLEHSGYVQGRYTMTQDAHIYWWGFYGYGHGYSGFGGGNPSRYPTASYCATGASSSTDQPCSPVVMPDGSFTTGTFGTPESGRPALIPPFQGANFMLVDGSYNPNGTDTPGKIWCQTIDRGASAGNVTYYSFSMWVENLQSDFRVTGVPLLRMTICDMEDPDNPDNFPAIGDAGTVTDVSGANTRLPGLTEFQTTGETFHNPEPLSDYNFYHAIRYGKQDPYGAAMPCNLPGENPDIRIKVMGQSFLVPVKPDRWRLIRCIYRAPAQVVKFNACIENLSLMIHGNDFAMDNIQLYECTNSELNADQFQDLLKSDPCELSTDPVQQSLTAPLRVEMLDFTGKLLGDYVYLNWLVLSELNVEKYEVQKSLNGKDFYVDGIVDAHGNQNKITEYEYADDQIPTDQRYLYYRLRMIGIDGKSRLSNVIRILISNDDLEMKLSPNPVLSGEEVEVEFNTPAGLVALEVYDILGKQLQKNLIKVDNGENKAFINTKGLQNGIYIITLRYQDVDGKLQKISKRLSVVK